MKHRIQTIGMTLIIVLASVSWFATSVNANGWHFGMRATNEGFSTISSGAFFSMAIKEDGSLWAWGSNEYGQLGDGTATIIDDNWVIREDLQRFSPVKIMDDVASVLAVRNTAYAIRTDGSLWAWGTGIIGDGEHRWWRDYWQDYTAITPVRILDSVVSITAFESSIAMGGSAAFAIRTDGSLWAWGENDIGQLGDGTFTVRDENWNVIEDARRLSPVKIMDDVVYVTTGDDQTFVIRSDGSLWSWGSTRYGLLGCGTVGGWGDGRPEFRATPEKVMDNVAFVSSGWDNTMVIKTDGSLWAWGVGYLGDGTVREWHEPQITPVKIMDDVAYVYGNRILKTDGTLWVWADNAEQTSPVQVLDYVESIVRGSGGSYTMVIRKDGSLWGWGSNLGGQLGDGTESYFYNEYGVFYYFVYDRDIATFVNNDRPQPFKIMDSVRAVTTFGLLDPGTTMVLQNDGSLWTWGSNSSGQIGDGTTERRLSPVQIMNGVAMPGSIEVNYPVYIPEPKVTPEPLEEPEVTPESNSEQDLPQTTPIPLELSPEEPTNNDTPEPKRKNNTLYWALAIIAFFIGGILIIFYFIKKFAKQTFNNRL